MSASLGSLEALDEAVQRATQDATLRQLNFYALPTFYCQELSEQDDSVSPRWTKGRAKAPRAVSDVAASETKPEVATDKLAFHNVTDLLLRVTLGDPRNGSFRPISLRRSRLRSSEELCALEWLERWNATTEKASGAETTTGALPFETNRTASCTEVSGDLVLQLTGPAGVKRFFQGRSSDWMQCTAVFHTERFDDLDMLVDVFWRRSSVDPVCATEDEPGRFIGRAAILASEMSELKGLLRRPLVNSAHVVIGEFVCEYCVIKPYAGELPTRLSHLRFDLVGSATDQRRVQLVGHRGAGSQKTRSRVQENTVLSFLTAIRKGVVDAIELDVQLTRDQVPVIYHDFFIRCSEDDVDESDDEGFQGAGSAALKKQYQRAHLRASRDDSSSTHAEARSSELNARLERPHRGVADAANDGCSGESQHSPGDERAIVDERSSGILDQRAAKNPNRSLGSGVQSLAQRFRNDDPSKGRKWREHGVPIYSMTYEQFKSACGSLPRSCSRSGGLCLNHSCRAREQRLSDELLDVTRAASSADNLGYLERHFSDTGVSSHDSNPVAMIRDNALPSLRRVLDRVPEEITLLIEIKYPMPEFMRETSLPYPERNQFIDRILEVIFQKGSLQRRIVFLSFDPDVCLMVRKKQTIYPVCFLNAAGRSLMSEHRDPRALSVVNGIAFAVWAGLDGMVLLCDLIFEEPGIVQVIHSAGLKVYCYGNCTADPDSCEQLIQWGVDGIIADRVGYIARALYPRFLTDGTTNSMAST